MVAATAALLISCGQDGTAAIVEIQETNDSLTVDVIVDTCNADLSVEAEESETAVVFDVRRSDRSGSLDPVDDCLDLVRVELAQPLGERVPTRSDGSEIPIVQLIP